MFNPKFESISANDRLFDSPGWGQLSLIETDGLDGIDFGNDVGG